MKKQNIFPILGLTSSSLLIITYLLTFALYFLDISTKGWTLSFNFFSPFFVFCIFLAFKYIIVHKSNLDNFKVVIYLILISQIFLLMTAWITKFKIMPAKSVPILSLITGLVMTGLYLWFFILILRTNKTEIKVFSYLKYYAITFLIFMIIRAITSIIILAIATLTIREKNIYFDLVNPLLELIPFIFLIFFFSEHIEKSDDNLEKIPNA